MNWLNERWCVVDTETTGTDAAVDRVVELGAVIVQNGEVLERFSRLINPGVSIPPAATEVHNISDADVAGAPSFADVAIEFGLFVGEAIAGGFNARFDRAMLIAEYLRAGVAAPPFLRGGERAGWIDAMCWSRAHNPYVKGAGSQKLGAVATRLGVELGTAHRAVGDCETTARILKVLATVRLHRDSGLDRMPTDLEELRLHQRRLLAEREANFVSYLLSKGKVA